MNKTQKSAWFCLATFLLFFAMLLYVVIKIFLLKTLPDTTLDKSLLAAVYLFAVVTPFFIMRKKQSPAEVDLDERDTAIKRKAVLVAFVSVWVLLAAVSLIPQLILSKDASIPIWFLPIINLAVFYIVLFIYTVTILIQYGWEGRDGK